MYKWGSEDLEVMIIFYLSKLWKAKFFILHSGEAAGEIWNRSLLGVKGNGLSALAVRIDTLVTKSSELNPSAMQCCREQL